MGLLAAASVAGLVIVPSGGSVALVTRGGAEGAAAVLSASESAGDVAVEPGSATTNPSPATVPPSGVAAPGPSAAPNPAAATRGPAPRSSWAVAPAAATGAAGGAPAPAIRPTTIDTGLWAGESAGPLRLLSPEPGWTPLAWSPDSREVAAARGGDVVVFEPGSGSRRRLLSRPGMTAARGASSPDGRSLAVILSDPSSTSPRLEVVDVASGAATQVPLRNSMTNLAYTPSGCLAVADTINGRSGIALHCPGQSPRVLPLPASLLAGGLGTYGLAYTVNGPSDITVVDFEGRPLPGISGRTSLYGSHVAWDQAGGTILWQGSHGGQTPRVELYASRAGGPTATLSKCSTSAPTASTNGAIVYADACRTGPAVLLRRAGPAGTPQTVATIPYYRTATPLLSPDGRWLLTTVSPT